jgi:hypothetical protein
MIPTSGSDPRAQEKITVSDRKANEIDGKRKQYSESENPKIFRPGILLS